MPWAILGEEHSRAIAEIYMSNSDRVAAIVGVAILDESLRLSLSGRFRDDKNITSKLLKVSGALGNTVPKIDMLYQLYAFEKPVRNAMYGLAEARNFLAHNLESSLKSKDPKLMAALEKMTLHEGLTHYPHPLDGSPSKVRFKKIKTHRARLLENLKLCLIALMTDRMSHKKWSNAPLSVEDRKKAFTVQYSKDEKQNPSQRKRARPNKAAKRNPAPSRKAQKFPPAPSRA